MMLNILDTEEKIINYDFKTLDELVEVFYFFLKQNYVSYDFNKRLIEKNSDLILTINDLLKETDKYGRLFDRKVDIFNDKISKTVFIRRMIKSYSKNIGKEMSQNKLKKLISACLSLTMSQISKQFYCSCFDDETMSNLFELILDENLIKNEFDQIINRLVFDNSLFINDDNFEYIDCFANIISKVYVDYFFNEQEDFESLKNELNVFSKMTNNEVKKLYKKINEKHQQIREKYAHEKEEKIDIAVDKITDQVLPRLKEEGINLDETLAKKNFKAFLNNDSKEKKEEFALARKIFAKTKDIINKYFKYEDELDEEFLTEAYIKITKAYFYNDKIDHPDFLMVCSSYLNDSYNSYEEKKKLDETNAFLQHFVARDFMLYLAHYLLVLPSAFKEDLLQLCHDILNENLTVSNNYAKIMKSFEIMTSAIAYSPVQIGDCVIVMSVLSEINQNNTILRKLKRLLIRHYKHINDDLDQKNMKEHEFFFEVESDLSNNERIHEYAVTFMFNYFQAPIYIAPLSAFVYEFNELLESSAYYYQADQAAVEKIGVESEIKGNKVYKKAFDYYNEIDRLIASYDDIDTEEIEDVISSKYSVLFIVSIQKDNSYDDFFDCVYMLKKYQKNLAMILSYDHENISYGFMEWCDEEKIELLWEFAIQISLIQEIYKSNKYIPKEMDLSKDDYTHSLEKTIDDLNEQIKEKDTENLILKNQVNSLNKIIKNSNDVRNNELEKGFNREIHDLNKIVVEQNKRIKELAEESDELYKLRSLMFELEKQEDLNIKEDVVYEKKLLEISEEKKIIFVGGHIKLLDVLKTKYPNMIFIGNRNNISAQLITTADYIFFFYNFLNHALYYKIMGMIKANTNIKWDYISSKNLELVEKDIFNKIEKMSK